MQDMFGNMLRVGDHILHAEWDVKVHEDGSEEEVPSLSIYRITEMSPGEIKGELLNGATGNWFYIESPATRTCRIGDNRSMYDVAGCFQDSVVH